MCPWQGHFVTDMLPCNSSWKLVCLPGFHVFRDLTFSFLSYFFLSWHGCVRESLFWICACNCVWVHVCIMHVFFLWVWAHPWISVCERVCTSMWRTEGGWCQKSISIAFPSYLWHRISQLNVEITDMASVLVCSGDLWWTVLGLELKMGHHTYMA